MADEKKAAAPKKKKIPAYKAGKACPECGAGTRLADHKDRRACGKCGYFEKK